MSSLAAPAPLSSARAHAPPPRYRLACLQLHCSTDLDANFAQCSTLIRRAVAQGASVIVTPENTHRLAALTLPAPASHVHVESKHPILRRYRALAAELRVWIILGSMAFRAVDDGGDDESAGSATSAGSTEPGTGKLVNRSLCIAPHEDPAEPGLGTVVARYDKIHLFDVPHLGRSASSAPPTAPIESYLESARIQAGSKATVVRTPFGAFGLSVCYDVRFPHLYRALAHAGADVLCIPAAFTVVTGRAHWHTLLRARAIETGCYVVAPAQCGEHPGARKTYGHSLVVDPWGDIVAESAGIDEIDAKVKTAAQEGGDVAGGYAAASTTPSNESSPYTDLLLVDIDLERVADARRRIPSLLHDRPFEVDAVDAQS